MTYNAAGQTTGFTLGNGVTETFGYDSQRLQMITQTAAKGQTTLASLKYGYSAGAGQMGVGTSAGNTDSW
jgi:YD repeat-containing protein